MRTASLSFKNEVLTKPIYLLFALAGALSLVLRPAKADFFESVSSLEIKQQAFRLMEALSTGNVDSYYFQLNKTPAKWIKKVFQVVNFDGDNILHFLVRLEKFADPEAIFYVWRHAGTILGGERLIQALVQENKNGISPAMEAAFSKFKERTDLAHHFPPGIRMMTDLANTLGPPETRGRAYDALHFTVSIENEDPSNSRTIMDIGLVASMSIFSFSAGYPGFTFSHGPSMAVSAAAAAGAASICALAVRRVSRKRALAKTVLD